MDDLLKAMDAVPPAERVGPDWGPNGRFAKRFQEVMKEQSELFGKFALGSDAIERSDKIKADN